VRVLSITAALDALFAPRRIALVGASDEPGKTGTLLWRNLAAFGGEVVPVTRSASTVGGRAAYPTLAAVEGDVDLVVVVVPAAAVPGVLAEAGGTGARAAVVLSGGFAETGSEGVRRQDALMAAARASGVRVLGPNCFGVQNTAVDLNASLAGGTPPTGGISLVTQSGAYGMALSTLAVDEHAGFAKVCATGNKADVTDAELLRYLGADPDTRTLCFFLESLPDGRAFAEAASTVTPGKPVVVAKTGRSVAGARAAQSHTAALAGSERVWRAALDRAGVVLARSGLEMLDVARALDTQPVPRGRRVAVITNSGGTGVELTDLLADEGLDVPELSAALQEELRPLLPSLASVRNPVDVTPVWRRFAELYPLLVDRLARSGEVDVVIPVLLQRAASDDVAGAVRDAVAGLRRDGLAVPVYVCWVAPQSQRAHTGVLQQAGVPCFEWPERTARAAGHAVRYGAARERLQDAPGTPRPLVLGPLPPGPLDVETGEWLLRAADLPVVGGRLCGSVAEAEAAAAELGYPVVAKAVRPGLVHKSDAGGVRVGLTGRAAVGAAVRSLLRLAPEVLIQAQASGTEVAVGGLRDPQFGPVVLVGLGGILVEVLDDVALGLAPLSRADVRRMLAGLRGAAVLTGARGAPPVDVESLVTVVSAVGDMLVSVPAVTALDLNPVLVSDRGCVVVDWHVEIGNPPGQDHAEAVDSPRRPGETDT
jgi:acyl-CoA synthetase (NDP forming)